MSLKASQFKYKKDIKLKTSHTMLYEDDDHYDDQMKGYQKDLSKIQEKLYAHDQYSVLIIFQARDAAGKDSTIKNIFKGLNPIGLNVRSFKRPSELELDHDYLWRTTKKLPPRGEITIFNRSYYEEVLVTRVHPQIIRNYQKLPRALKSDFSFLFENRYRDINNFEKFLNNNGTKVIKFYLNVSKQEQKTRFLRRIDIRRKNWKFSEQDIVERGFWNKYTKAYETCFRKTHTQKNPWYIIPADDKRNMRLIIANILVEELSKLPVNFPRLNKEEKEKLLQARKKLLSE